MMPAPPDPGAASPAPAGDALMLLFEQQTQEHAIVVLDPQGRIIRWNNAAERILGWTRDDVIGQPVSMIFTDRDVSMGAPAHELSVALSVGLAEDDRWHVRKDGARIWVSGAVTPLRSPEGELLGYAKVMRDRTDVRVQVTALENRVKELSQEKRLRQEYFARLAHEVRNALAPLRNVFTIIGFAKPQQQEFALSVGRRQLEVLNRLAQDAAELATIHAGKLELALARTDLGDVLRGAAEAARQQAQAKEQGLELLLVPGPIMVECDPQRLHQVVFNLLHNAVKYTPKGGRIWLKSSVEDKYALIRVEDNGIGIDAGLLPRIFDLFTQASVESSEGGLGVGLSLVKELVQAHGGVVEVRSEGLGKGSDFTVRLPLRQARMTVGSGA